MTCGFFRFLVVGVIGFVVDGGGTWLLVHLGMAPMLARLPPLPIAIFIMYRIHRSLTFRFEAPENRAAPVRYGTVALSSGLLDFHVLATLLLLHRFGVHRRVAAA